ncbi:hypothetical protein FHS87_001623 [Roseomonas pecuniae]|uniref:Uncharacterized protein n=1 Tax=Muricoccus pecuniae TaxID=693023 RepID=A0A840Y1V3_9PROT|nr:hypothetical protein [Roseomonas pecuniae]MBB5693590.1 hypothetical protein [Roseomonas pecuniae]
MLRWVLRLSRSGTFERLAHALTMADRERLGREASPTAVVLDAPSARSGGVGVKEMRGYDTGKKVTRRKRRALVDTDGRLLMAAASPVSLHESRGVGWWSGPSLGSADEDASPATTTPS